MWLVTSTTTTTIVLSRFWLFPGILGDVPTRNRSECDAEIEEYLGPKLGEVDDDMHHTFGMKDFLERARFPEFRVLLRCFRPPFNWAGVRNMEDIKEADRITAVAQAQVMTVFPLLDVLNCASTCVSLANPLNWVRWLSRVSFTSISLTKAKTIDPSSVPKGCLVARTEWIEKDDVYPDATKPIEEREEPVPWGTIRLTDYDSTFKEMTATVNAVCLFTFFLQLTGFFFLMFGEINFYTATRIAHDKFLANHPEWHSENVNACCACLRACVVWCPPHPSPPRARVALFLVFTTVAPWCVFVLRAQDGEAQSTVDDAAWAMEPGARHLLHQAGTAIVLLILITPYAIQSSALLTENLAAPLLTMATMKVHVRNFLTELDQYLMVLAMNRGSLDDAALASDAGLNEKEKLMKNKKDMARDMALSWRIRRFMMEIEKDAEVINSGVALMVLNLICHLIPLNIFVYSHGVACVPLWVVLFTATQSIGLGYVIMSGIDCNDLINFGLNSFLHNWQLKFNMIGWSGGFLVEDGADYKAYVTREPDYEALSKLKGEGKDLEAIRSFADNEERNRIESIVRVLHHYELEPINPFK